MGVQVSVKAMRTGLYEWACWEQQQERFSEPTSWADVQCAVLMHAPSCQTCREHGAHIRAAEDVQVGVDWCVGTAVAVFGMLGLQLEDPEAGMVGELPAEVVLVACQIALATGCPVLYARPAYEGPGMPTQGGPVADLCGAGWVIDMGVSEQRIMQAVADLADVATHAFHLGRTVVWE